MCNAFAWAAMAIICLILLAAMIIAFSRSPKAASGGAAPRRATRPPAHIIVDTLNLTHWTHPETKHITLDTISDTIVRTAAPLREKFPGRVIYVLKDRESRFNDDLARSRMQKLAEENSIYICVAERYQDPPSGSPPSDAHSAQGRDDFYTAILAHQHRCPVVTGDALKDFTEFRATIQPFQVYEFAFWRAIPERTFIRPSAAKWATLRRPRTIRPEILFPRHN